MILTGHEDLRVVKTIESIKENFKKLICEKPYEKITVKELCERAQINKKTFYHYYETMDALLLELSQEMNRDLIQRIKKLNPPEDLAEINQEFFDFAQEQEEAYEKIALVAGNKSRHIIVQANDIAWSKSTAYQKLSNFEQGFLMDFINESMMAAYRRWVETGKSIPAASVVKMLNDLQIGGIKEFFEARK